MTQRDLDSVALSLELSIGQIAGYDYPGHFIHTIKTFNTIKTLTQLTHFIHTINTFLVIDISGYHLLC